MKIGAVKSRMRAVVSLLGSYLQQSLLQSVSA
jgi:hypothetical protein